MLIKPTEKPQAVGNTCRFNCPHILKIFQLEQGINAGIPNMYWKYKYRGQVESSKKKQKQKEVGLVETTESADF